MTDTHGNEPRHDDPKHAADAQRKAADEQRKADEKRTADANKKTDERREAAFKSDTERREAEHKADTERLAAARKYVEAKRKEDERRAALSPPDRTAEDDKRAAMTPEERLADDESKGLVKPEQFDQINLLVAGSPQFPLQTEGAHSAEFIISEANHYLSRDAATVAIGDSLKVGQTVKIVTPATLTAPAVVTGNVTTDVAADGIAIYAVPVGTVAQNVAVISRNSEVNGNLLYYPATITATDKLNIAKALLVHNIAVRL